MLSHAHEIVGILDDLLGPLVRTSHIDECNVGSRLQGVPILDVLSGDVAGEWSLSGLLHDVLPTWSWVGMNALLGKDLLGSVMAVVRRFGAALQIVVVGVWAAVVHLLHVIIGL